MKSYLKILIVFSTLLAFTALDSYSQTTGQHRIKIEYSTVLMSKNDEFKFSFGGFENIKIDWNDRSVYFNRRLSKGERYSVTQLSGTRNCSFWSINNQGTIGDADIVIWANCGYPPTVGGTLTVSGIEQSETFIFGNEYGNSYYATINRSYPIQNFPIGDLYIFKQLSGPRQCKMTNAEGRVTSASLAINANCGRTIGGGNPTPTPVPTPKPPVNPTNFDLVSRSANDKIVGTFFETFTPVVGGTGADEGRYVAYVTYTKGLGGSSGKYRQVVWRDMKTGETRLVSQGMNGIEGNQNSHAPAI